MKTRVKITGIKFTLLLALLLACAFTSTAGAATKAEIDKKVAVALDDLMARSPAARDMYPHAKGVLVFPDIIKGGLIVGGQYGEGALLVNGRTVGYYNTIAASYGLQAGVQSFGYALFLMTDKAMKYLNASAGWELGVGPTVVIVDEGIAKSLSTTTAQDDVYSFFFDQQGLMAGMGLQGSKISRIHPH